MNRKRLIMAVLLVLVLVSSAAALGLRPGVAVPTGNAVGVIFIEGTILAGEGEGGLTGAAAGSDRIMRFLKQAREDARIKAVVLRINSPGGTAAASQEIAVEVKKLRDAGKKVVTSMGDVAASGGYWIASGSDLIVANPGTQTGSIGVIMQITNLQELMAKLGIRTVTIKSGPLKDIGSPSRDVTPEERELLQGMVNDIFDQFVKTVAEGRRLPEDRVRRIADGRVFTGRQAMAEGLVDEMGNLEDAIARAGQLAGLAPGFDVIEFGRLTPLERLLFGIGARGTRLEDILPGSGGIGRPDLWGWLIDPAGGK